MPGAITEALGDTGGARSLIDLGTATAMDFKVQYAWVAEFGTFYGPGGKEQTYLGVVKGPILLFFLADMVVYLHELVLYGCTYS